MAAISKPWNDRGCLTGRAMAVETIGSRPRAKVAPWNDPVIRGWVLQIVVVGLVGVLLCLLISNTIGNLRQQNIAGGFHFLAREAGFEIGDSVISYSPTSTYGRAILVGLLNTLRVSVLGIILATIIGTLIGIGRLSRNWLLAKICEWHVEVFRNVPLLLWLFLFYKLISEAFPGPRQAVQLLWGTTFLSNRGLYFPAPVDDPIHIWMALGLLVGIAAAWLIRGWAKARQAATGQPFPIVRVGAAVTFGVPFVIWLLAGAPLHMSWPELTGFNFSGGMVIQPEFTALLIGLVLYFSAFIAEIVRSGIVAVSKGQGEAAAALGLTRAQELRLVLLPQAMRVIIPPMTNQFLRITRSSSLAIAIGYPDLVATVNVTINQTGQAAENVLIIVAAYLTVSLSISAFMNWYNKRLALRER
jgi:general L-amino acid transport system permease protein